MGWPEKDDPPQPLRVEGRESLTGNTPGKGITGVGNNQSPRSTRIRGRLECLFDHESKVFGVIGVEGTRHGWRSR
jgi:hypothetical protein